MKILFWHKQVYAYESKQRNIGIQMIRFFAIRTAIVNESAIIIYC